MYAREVAGRELTFDFAEGLLKDNLLFVDRETGSLWSQLHGKAIEGPLKDSPLRVIPSLQTTWKFWREAHPDSRVVVAKNGNGRPYYYFRPGSERDRTLKMHDASSLGLGIAAGEESLFFPFRELNKADLPLHAELNGEKIKILYEKKEMTAWAVDPEGTLLSGVLAYQSGWLRFFPDSKVFKNKRSRR